MRLTERAKSALRASSFFGSGVFYQHNGRGYLKADETPAESPAIVALTAFAAQNPGLEFANYGEVSSYRSEARGIAKDWHRFVAALKEASLYGVTDADVIAASKHAFSGRLTWTGKGWDYCTGQYWPTEYRAAAATVLESATHAKKQAEAEANPPAPVAAFKTIAEVKAQNAASGGCWFDRGSMRFFGTRIHGGIYKGRYFITSEQPPHGPRMYSVREAKPDGDIDTVGEFCGYRSLESAREAVKSL